jgi:hypothetical protein
MATQPLHRATPAAQVLCPRCEQHYFTDYGAEGPHPKPALSRQTRGANDDPVYVCSACGAHEAMEEFAHGTGRSTPIKFWPVRY